MRYFKVIKQALIVLVIILSNSAFSQPESRHSISLSGGAAYLTADKEFAPAIALDYGYAFLISEHEFSVSISAENIFTDHPHYAFGLGFGIPIWNALEISLGPELAFDDSKMLVKAHIGFDYSFDVNNFSFGPALAFSLGQSDHHIIAAFSCGYSF